jgi:hypothetical protein
MREAVAPGGQADEAGVGANDGPSVSDGAIIGADGEADAAEVTVAVGVGLAPAPKVGLADGRATTALAGVGLVVPPPKGGKPSIAVTTAKRATTTSPTPTIERIGRCLRGSPFTWLDGLSLARRVPRTYRGQLTWTRWRQTSSC